MLQVDVFNYGGIVLAFVAIYTIAKLKHSYDHPVSIEFIKLGNEVFQQAARTGQLVADFPPPEGPLPQEATEGEGFPMLTLTVWNSILSPYRFAYAGRHKQALRDRDKWIDSHPPQEKKPKYVVWWVEKEEDVSWDEAFKRYNFYIEHGPTPFAFDFKHAFDKFGETVFLK